MTNALREQVFRLSAAERMELLEDLWNSLANNDSALQLTVEQRDDLDQRLREADADPESGSSWDEVRERIRQRHQ
jgi:putative addiction module component (TIGR02574 family)